MIPEDNLYKYLYVRVHLWAYLVRRITPNRINLPLIGLLDVELPQPHIESLTEGKKHSFIIHLALEIQLILQY